MEYGKLVDVAEALRSGLEIKKSESLIHDYEINTIPDDLKIEIIVFPADGVQAIKIDLLAGKSFI